MPGESFKGLGAKIKSRGSFFNLSAKKLKTKHKRYIAAQLFQLIDSDNLRNRLLDLSPANIRYNAQTKQVELNSFTESTYHDVRENIKARYGCEAIAAVLTLNAHLYNLYQACLFICELFEIPPVYIQRLIVDQQLPDQPVIKEFKQNFPLISDIINALIKIPGTKIEQANAESSEKHITIKSLSPKQLEEANERIQSLVRQTPETPKSLKVDINFGEHFSSELNERAAIRKLHRGSSSEDVVKAAEVQRKPLQEKNDIFSLLVKELDKVNWRKFTLRGKKPTHIQSIYTIAKQITHGSDESAINSAHAEIFNIARVSANRSKIYCMRNNRHEKVTDFYKIVAKWNEANAADIKQELLTYFGSIEQYPVKKAFLFFRWGSSNKAVAQMAESVSKQSVDFRR